MQARAREEAAKAEAAARAEAEAQRAAQVRPWCCICILVQILHQNRLCLLAYGSSACVGCALHHPPSLPPSIQAAAAKAAAERAAAEQAERVAAEKRAAEQKAAADKRAAEQAAAQKKAQEEAAKQAAAKQAVAGKRKGPLPLFLAQLLVLGGFAALAAAFTKYAQVRRGPAMFGFAQALLWLCCGWACTPN